MDDKEKSNHSMKNLPLKFHLDIGKMYISHLNIKTLRFNGHYHFRCCITHTYHFRLFLMKGGLLYEETRFQSFKRTVKTQKGYAGDSVHTLKQVEQGNLYIAQKNLVNKMKIFKGPLFLEGLFIPH